MTNFNEGLHLCRITRQGWITTQKEPKRPMLVFAFQVLSEVHHDDEGNETFEDVLPGDSDPIVRVLVDGSNETILDFALRKLRYAGFTSGTFQDLELVGYEVRCLNRHKHYNGRLYDDWELGLPPMTMQDWAPIQGEAARRLDAIFGDRLKNGAPTKSAARNSGPRVVSENSAPEDTSVSSQPAPEAVPF